jgi:hypothetical protein
VVLRFGLVLRRRLPQPPVFRPILLGQLPQHRPHVHERLSHEFGPQLHLGARHDLFVGTERFILGTLQRRRGKFVVQQRVDLGTEFERLRQRIYFGPRLDRLQQRIDLGKRFDFGKELVGVQ